MNRIFVLIVVCFLGITGLKGQKSISLDVFGTTFYATEGNLNVGIYYHQKIGNRTGLQIGLSLGRYITERTVRDSSILGPKSNYYRELWGLAITPEYRYYFKTVNDEEHNRGFFLSPYGKAFLSWVNTDDFTQEVSETEFGYILGIGIGLGYVIEIKKWAITPYIGLGKGVSSHKDIFSPGGFDLDFANPDLLIHRIELLIGYNF